MHRLAILILPFLAACPMALGPKEVTPREASIAGAIAIAADTAAVTASALTANGNGQRVAIQETVGTITALLPAAMLFAGEPGLDHAGTPGEAYQMLGRALFGSLGVGATTVVPWLATYYEGEADHASPHPKQALVATLGGTLVGTVASVYLGDHLPKWARVPVAASLIGTLSTLGYGLGSR